MKIYGHCLKRFVFTHIRNNPLVGLFISKTHHQYQHDIVSLVDDPRDDAMMRLFDGSGAKPNDFIILHINILRRANTLNLYKIYDIRIQTQFMGRVVLKR